MAELSRDLARAIRAEFLRVLDDAVPPYGIEELKIFDPADEQFIAREVERKLYEPKLPFGGARERKITERLKRMAADRGWDNAWRADMAAQRFAAVEGRYYTRKPIPAKGKDYDFCVAARDSAHQHKDWERKWFWQLWIDGLPELVSDFRMECLFLLEKPNGEMDRLVRLRNVAGEAVGPIALDPEAFHAPQKFRQWCVARGNFAYQGGEKELQRLHEDVGRSIAYRTVKLVQSFGWHALGKHLREDGTLPGIWFFDDCAIADGKVVRPDGDGIFWHNGKGYRVGEMSREGMFVLKRPTMEPDRAAVQMVLGDTPFLDGVTELDALRALFHGLATRINDNLGGDEGLLALGSMLAFAAAPEIYRRESNFPGLWIHGEAGGGKTTLCEVLTRLWGFDLQAGLSTRSKQVTAVGMLQTAEQYENLPVWFDEFRQWEVPEDKSAIIQSGYNRDVAAKYSPTGLQRKINTGFIVCGESTTSDAATRGRYPHIQVAKPKRKGSYEEQKQRHRWLMRHKDYYRFLGRHVLLHRAQFVACMQRHLEDWQQLPEIEDVHERLRAVHGVPYAALRALNEMLELFPHARMEEFKQFMLKHSKSAAVDVSSEVNANVFWEDLITAFKAGAIEKSCFRVKQQLLDHPPGAPDQTGGWAQYILYLDPNSVVSAMKIYQAKERSQWKLNKKDLRDQLAQNAYWVPGGKAGHTVRFGKSVVKAWAVNLDYHPLGYQPAPTDEWRQQRMNEGGDIRKGPLFEIVESFDKEDRGHIDPAELQAKLDEQAEEEHGQ